MNTLVSKLIVKDTGLFSKIMRKENIYIIKVNRKSTQVLVVYVVIQSVICGVEISKYIIQKFPTLDRNLYLHLCFMNRQRFLQHVIETVQKDMSKLVV